jgi:hypothetical protein
MITSWANEEDKANAKYDSIHDKSKNNMGVNNNKDHGGHNNNNYSGPNRKHKPDNTVVAIQCPAKELHHDISLKGRSGFVYFRRAVFSIGWCIGFSTIPRQVRGSPALTTYTVKNVSLQSTPSVLKI